MLPFKTRISIAIDIHAEIALYEMRAWPYNDADSDCEGWCQFHQRIKNILWGVTGLSDGKWIGDYVERMSPKVSEAVRAIMASKRVEQYKLKKERLLTFELPLSNSDKVRIEHYIRKGIGVTVGGCGLYPDAINDIIWGVDHYGCDGVASGSVGDLESALKWVGLQNQQAEHYMAVKASYQKLNKGLALPTPS